MFKSISSPVFALGLLLGCDAYDEAQPLSTQDTPIIPPVVQAPPASFAEQLDHVDVLVDGSLTTVEVYDGAGERIATITQSLDWPSARVSVHFADGGAFYKIDDVLLAADSNLGLDELVIDATLPAEVIHERVQAIQLEIAENHPNDPQESRWFGCGVAVAASAAACAGAGASLGLLVVGCGAGVWASACKCLQAAHPDDPSVWEGPCAGL